MRFTALLLFFCFFISGVQAKLRIELPNGNDIDFPLDSPGQTKTYKLILATLPDGTKNFVPLSSLNDKTKIVYSVITVDTSIMEDTVEEIEFFTWQISAAKFYKGINKTVMIKPKSAICNGTVYVKGTVAADLPFSGVNCSYEDKYFGIDLIDSDIFPQN